jgi:hypothetical protein
LLALLTLKKGQRVALRSGNKAHEKKQMHAQTAHARKKKGGGDEKKTGRCLQHVVQLYSTYLASHVLVHQRLEKSAARLTSIE